MRRPQGIRRTDIHEVTVRTSSVLIPKGFESISPQVPAFQAVLVSRLLRQGGQPDAVFYASDDRARCIDSTKKKTRFLITIRIYN